MAGQEPAGAGRRALFGSIEWVFFDIGNTLVDESEAIAQRAARISATAAEMGYHGLAPDDVRRRLETAAGARAHSPLRAALEALGIAEDHIPRLAAACPYDNRLERLYPESIAILERLSGRFRLGYVANQSPGLPSRLEALGIGRFFAAGSDSGSSRYAKPDERLFREALDRAGCPAARSVMVGDRIDNDIVPARRVGMLTIRIQHGYSRLQQPEADHERADVTVRSPSELAALVGA